MKLKLLIAGLAALLLAQPMFAAVVKYSITADQSTKFPTDGTILRPGTTKGAAFIDDVAITLTQFTLKNTFIDIVGGTTTSGIPGTTVIVDSSTTAKPAANQTGAGSTATSISWGSLTGWSQTGRLICTTNCPGGCPTGVSSCVPFVGFEGTGPPAPLKSTSFTNDPWTFSGGGTGYSTASIEMVNLTGGAVTANQTWGGGTTLTSVPAIPLIALGGLGAGLLYLGSRALRRKSD